MLHIDRNLNAADLAPKVARLWESSAPKLTSIERSCHATSKTVSSTPATAA